MITIPVPVKVLECFCVGKRKMKGKDIAEAIREDQEAVGFALSEFVERSILVEEGFYYSLSPDHEESCRKIVEIYETIKISSGQKIAGICAELHPNSETLYIM